MEIDSVIDAASLSKAVRQPVCDRIDEKCKNPDELWKWRVISGLFVLSFEHYDGLIDANKRNLSLSTIAFHARSLLELFVWTRYALDSDENIKRIHADSLNDAKDIAAKMAEVANRSDGKFAFDEAAALNKLRNLANTEGHAEPTKKFIRLNQLPIEDVIISYYESENKILSKLAHPCGLTIVGMVGESTEEEIKPMIVKAGCRWFSTVVKALAPMIDLEVTWQPEH